jgi:hypothetical protein
LALALQLHQQAERDENDIARGDDLLLSITIDDKLAPGTTVVPVSISITECYEHITYNGAKSFSACSSVNTLSDKAAC